MRHIIRLTQHGDYIIIVIRLAAHKTANGLLGTGTYGKSCHRQQHE